MSYTISIVVHGPGDDPNHRSHWSFALYRDNSVIGNVLHVVLLDLNKLIYGFDKRTGVSYHSRSSEGIFTVANLTHSQYLQADRIISQEPPPRNGKDRCQDWAYNCIIALEVEEIVPSGTSQWISGLVGQPAAVVEKMTGSRWKRTFRS
ncbi:hypothetical protein CC78DRAFT_350808 [Lojkania enalia]|uniref:Uncharacterized protein n=1 Tax=Lojkania enalia TaxID=147567 RepID=A0A9P4KHA9_9PLEO|nr:hypothetical protein CC78DRAFT_350808 [Didymosphaeria enalia]